MVGTLCVFVYTGCWQVGLLRTALLPMIAAKSPVVNNEWYAYAVNYAQVGICIAVLYT